MMKHYASIAALASALVVAPVVASANELTIATVNNGHMINMQTVAEAYTAETGVELNWVSLEEGVLREQVTSDTATGNSSGSPQLLVQVQIRRHNGALAEPFL